MNLFKKLNDSRKRAKYIKGFDYAAGALLRNETTIKELKRNTDARLPFNGCFDSFDIGVIAAIETINRKVVKGREYIRT